MAATLTVQPATRPVRGRTHRATPRPMLGVSHERVYRRRRALVGGAAAVVVAAVLAVVPEVLAGGGTPASAVDGVEVGATARAVVAHSGDTLWSIADRYRGDVPISRYVDVLVDLNGGASIQAGQSVKLP